MHSLSGAARDASVQKHRSARSNQRLECFRSRFHNGDRFCPADDDTPMSTVTRRSSSGKRIPVEVDIPASPLDEFDRAITALVAGERPRMDTLARDEGEIVSRAMAALQLIEAAIEAHPGTGQARRLVKFLAGVYNGEDYPFDLGELRALDTELANACLDYLNYDRLGKREVHKHLENGDRDLHRWFKRYDLLPRDA